MNDNEPSKRIITSKPEVQRGMGPSKAEMDRCSGGESKKAWVPKLEDRCTG
jgi:hypothetical protein